MPQTLENSVTEFIKRHAALVTVCGALVAWLSLYFVTKTEADAKFVHKDEFSLIRADIQEQKSDIREIRKILLERK